MIPFSLYLLILNEEFLHREITEDEAMPFWLVGMSTLEAAGRLENGEGAVL